MAKGYHDVTREERSQIRLLKAMRYSMSEIARQLKRHRVVQQFVCKLVSSGLFDFSTSVSY